MCGAGTLARETTIKVVSVIACGCWKTPARENRKNKIASGSPTSDVRGSPRHFLSPQFCAFGV